MGIGRRVAAAKRVGRNKRSFAFTLSAFQASGNPGPGCSGMKIRVWRHDKRHKTEEHPASGLAGIADQYNIAWDARVEMTVSLFESKTGKVFSDKIFQVSLFGRFGNRLAEVARADLNLSAIASVPEQSSGSPIARKLQLQPRTVGSEATMSVQFVLQCSEVAASDARDDTSEYSEGASDGGVSFSTLASEYGTGDQDLRGFEPSLEPIGGSPNPLRGVPEGRETNISLKGREKSHSVLASDMKCDVVRSSTPTDPLVAGYQATEAAELSQSIKEGYASKRAVSASDAFKNWRRRRAPRPMHSGSETSVLFIGPHPLLGCQRAAS